MNSEFSRLAEEYQRESSGAKPAPKMNQTLVQGQKVITDITLLHLMIFLSLYPETAIWINMLFLVKIFIYSIPNF